MSKFLRDHVIVSSARLRHQTKGGNDDSQVGIQIELSFECEEASIDDDENEDVLVQKALDVVAERMSKRVRMMMMMMIMMKNDKTRTTMMMTRRRSDLGGGGHGG